MYSITTVIAVISLLVSVVFGTPFQDCGSDGAKIVAVQVGDCTTQPCVFKRGTEVSFTMDFKAAIAITKATTKVYVFLGPIKVPFPLPDSNSCHYMTCPIKAGDGDTYAQNHTLMEGYPAVKIKVKWEIRGEDNMMITCFTTTAKII